VAHRAGAYPGFTSPLNGMLVHLYTWVRRGTAGVKCLAQEHNTIFWPGLEPRPLNPELTSQTTRPPRLPPTVPFRDLKSFQPQKVHSWSMHAQVFELLF